MSREVLLKVTSSAIEFADVMTIQASPIASAGAAASVSARRPAVGRFAEAVTDLAAPRSRAGDVG